MAASSSNPLAFVLMLDGLEDRRFCNDKSDEDEDRRVDVTEVEDNLMVMCVLYCGKLICQGNTNCGISFL